MQRETKMYCRNCGKEINDEAVICVHCGTATNYQQPIVQQPIVEPPKKKINVIGIVGFCISIVALLLIMVIDALAMDYIYIIATLASFILCVIGLTHFKKQRLSGFAIAGLVIAGIPLLVMLFIFVLTWLSVFGVMLGV